MLTPAAFVVILLSLPTEPPPNAWADRRRFPPSEVTIIWHEWAIERRKTIEAQINSNLFSMRPWVRDDLQQQLRETERIIVLLTMLTRFPYEVAESEEYWSVYMRNARSHMTAEEYATGILPWGGNSLAAAHP